MHSPLTFPALGTTAALLVDPDDALDDARVLLEGEIEAIDAACSRFRADSELSRANARSGSWFSASPVFMDALEVALRGARATDGFVDPTVGTAMRVLGYDRDFDRVDPDGPPLRVSVQRVAGWRSIDVDREQSAVRIPRGVELDFGATAKALCADRAARVIGDATGASVLVGLGGDVAVGGPPRPQGWAVLIADDHAALERDADERVVIKSGGLATSGTTARRWMRGDRALHHVVDPATGFPAAEYWRTVSVTAASCVDANIASTAAIVMGAGAIEWLDARNLPSRLVTVQGEVAYAGGWPVPTRSLTC